MAPESNTKPVQDKGAGPVVIGLLGVVFFLLACFFVSSQAYLQQQVPGEVADQGGPRAGFKTFQDEIYFPVRAMVTGVNPYTDDYKDFHPDQFAAVAVSPTTLALATPLGFISVLESQWTYLVLCFLLAVFTARVIFRSGGMRVRFPIALIVAGLMIICRPGMSELLGVGLVFPVVFGFAIALEHAKQNWLIAGLGFMITTCSLVFALPLAVLMLFRRDFRALGCGLLLTLGVWLTVVLVMARGDAAEFHRICRDDLAKPLGVLFQDHEIKNIDRACWERIDLTPPVSRVVKDGLLSGDTKESVDPAETDDPAVLPDSPPSNESSGRNDFGSRLALFDFPAGLAYLPRRLAYNGPIGLGNIVAIVCLVAGGICLFLEKRGSQREGLSSRSGLLIVLVTLLALPHPVSAGVLVWLPMVGLLVGFRKLVVGLHWFIRFLVVVVLLIFVFNFLRPDLLMQPAFMGGFFAAHPDSWQTSVMASLNPILLTIAAVLIGLSCLASQLFASDGLEGTAEQSGSSPGSSLSQRQKDWEKLRGK